MFRNHWIMVDHRAVTYMAYCTKRSNRKTAICSSRNACDAPLSCCSSSHRRSNQRESCSKQPKSGPCVSLLEEQHTHTHTLCTLYKQQSPIKYTSREPTWNSKTSKDWMIRISFSKTVWGWDVSFPVYTPHLKHLIPWFLGTRLCYSKPFWEMQWVYYESICTAEEESVEMCR